MPEAAVPYNPKISLSKMERAGRSTPADAASTAFENRSYVHKLPTLILLIFAYAAATWFPQPGLWARELRLPADEGLVGTWLSQIRTANVILAILLFSSGLSASWSAMRQSLRSRSQLLSLAGVTWALPLVAAVAVVVALKAISLPAEIAFALWIVAAMPVANSSVGWANVMRGNVPLSLTLLILSTCLSPLTSPLLISVGSRVFDIELSGGPSVATSGFGMAAFFAIWVLLPVALGAWGAGRLTPESAARIIPWARRISLVMLLLLNYLNGSVCLPSLINRPGTLVWPVAAAIGLVVGVAVLFRIVTAATSSRWGVTRLSGLAFDEADSSSRNTLLLSVMMRNTGVALVYTTAALPGYEAIGLTIIAYTLAQHLLVSLFVSWR